MACCERLLEGTPLFTTRLVTEASFTYDVRPKARTPAEVVSLVAPYFKDRDREEMLSVLLDTGASVIGVVQLSAGTRNQTLLDPSQVFRSAILSNASSVILVHNHPSGNSEPSREDIACTKKLVAAGRLLDIPIHDHIVIGDGYSSLAERGLISA